MKALLGRWFSLRWIMRATCWLTFAAFLVGLGWTIYQVLPPQPRWALEGDIKLQGFLPDSSAAVFVEKGDAERRQVTVRDISSGAVQISIPVTGIPDFTRDNTRWLWWHEEETLAGFDLHSGSEWRQTLPKWTYIRREWFSDDGEIAVLDGVSFDCIIDMKNGRILHRAERPTRETAFSFTQDGRKFTLTISPVPGGEVVRFMPDFITLGGRDRDLHIWDRHKHVGTTLPIRCHDAVISTPGNAMLIKERGGLIGGRGGPFKLLDYPEKTRPVEVAGNAAPHDPENLELAKGRADLSPDGKYLAHIHDDQIDLGDVAGRHFKTLTHGRINLSCSFCVFSADSTLLFATIDDGLAIYELPGGRELWRWQPSLQTTEFHYHAPTASLVGYPQVVIGGRQTRDPEIETFEIRDAASGRMRFSRTLGERPARVETNFSSDGRHVVLTQPLPNDDTTVIALLKKWLPDGWVRWRRERVPYSAVVIDIEEASLKFEGEIYVDPRNKSITISNDGQSVFVTNGNSDAQTIECWDIPFARPWGWIIGIPAGIGVSVLAWKWLRRNRKVAAS